jgi:hypothetical protein
MNIIVKNFGSDICNFRPDTTWEKDNEDFYPQEEIQDIAYTPVLFARISRAGRSVEKKFATRYFDSISYGVLLYDEGLLGSGALTAYACASCIDHTSFLPFPMYNQVTLGQSDNYFKLYKGTRRIFCYNEGNVGMIEDAISKATSHIYIRTGDLLCIELSPITHLASRKDGETRIHGTYCGNFLLDFKIIG